MDLVDPEQRPPRDSDPLVCISHQSGDIVLNPVHFGRILTIPQGSASLGQPEVRISYLLQYM
jgi:hypothetical protein